jgi:hypothetical protein
MAEIAIDKTKNGSIRNLMKPQESTVVLIRYAARVHMYVVIVDGRMWRQSRDSFHHIVER